MNLYIRREKCACCNQNVYYDAEASTVSCGCCVHGISYIDEFDLAQNWMHIETFPLKNLKSTRKIRVEG